MTLAEERAFHRAHQWAREHGEPEYYMDNGAVVLRVDSRTREGIKHIAAHGGIDNRHFCTCEAHINNKPCWHLALAEMISEGKEPWKTPIPSYLDIEIVYSE